jgi:hypothetical protein
MDTKIDIRTRNRLCSGKNAVGAGMQLVVVAIHRTAQQCAGVDGPSGAFSLRVSH